MREASLSCKREREFSTLVGALLAVTTLIKDSAELVGSRVPVISVAWLIRRWCFFRQLGAGAPMPVADFAGKPSDEVGSGVLASVLVAQ